jgi:nucleoside-diphosphate-sugar epimerase
MRILVTGGSGFIGSHLVESILERPEVDLVLNIDRLDECSTMRNHPNNSDGRFLFLKVSNRFGCFIITPIHITEGFIRFQTTRFMFHHD